MSWMIFLELRAAYVLQYNKISPDIVPKKSEIYTIQ